MTALSDYKCPGCGSTLTSTPKCVGHLVLPPVAHLIANGRCILTTRANAERVVAKLRGSSYLLDGDFVL